MSILKKNKLNIALTFDDGYLTHYYVAKVLTRIHIRATFFVITHLTKHPNNGEPLLTSQPKKIKEISKMGHEIGSHSCTHPNLLGLSPPRLEEELRDSKLFLEDIIEKQVYGFAYPAGAYNSRVIKEVKRHYFYGRGVHNSRENMWNMACDNRYNIHSVGTRHLPKIPLKLIKHHTSIKPVIMLHRESPAMILLLISILRSLYPKVEFITMKEMAELIDKGSE